MRARAFLALAILAGAPFVPTAIADPIGPHLEVTPLAGTTLFDGDDLPGGHPLQDDLYVGGRIAWHFHRMWGVEAAGGFTPTRQRSPGSADADFFHASGSVLFTPWAGFHGGPYLLAGGGTAKAGPSGADESHGSIEAGGGLRFWLTDALGLRLEARQLHYKTDSDGRANHLIVGGGLVFALGATPRDTDGDGVPDRKDACPDTPRGARVDARGCPADSDGDKVLDGLDKCEGTPAGCTVDVAGCQSDADGDGVCDGLDTCPDTPKGATVDAAGCPRDSDGDGVFDGVDQCADTPKGATVDARGCPTDADGDGVFDGLDKCPDTSAGLKVDADGCPIELVERETELLDTGMIRIQDVNFETNQAALLPESHAILDVVGHVLRKWPELKIEIGGHTDARGTNAANQRLSEARAKSVRDYLGAKFPDLLLEQFTVRGYGESRPLVPNTNELNWAKNRRVEFVVLNKDVLKRESEKRRLMRKDEAAPADTTAK